MENISLIDIKKAACGLNENSQPKAIVLLSCQKFFADNLEKDPEILINTSSFSAEVNMAALGGKTYINLKFPTDTHPDLYLLFNALERYFKEGSKDQQEYAIISSMTLIPIEFDGEYYINALDPISWSLLPDEIGGPLRNLRIVYEGADVNYFRSDIGNINIKGLIDAIENSDLDSFIKEENERIAEIDNYYAEMENNADERIDDNINRMEYEDDDNSESNDIMGQDYDPYA